MSDTNSRAIRHGAIAGVTAGLIFAVFEILAALALGKPWLMPLRMFASVVFGGDAMNPAAVSSAAAVIAGAIVHLGLSTAFGAVYGLGNASSALESRTSWGRQLALGGLFGVLLWIIDFQLIARNFYPWFLSAPQVLQLVLHAAFFGMPLGLLYAGLQRQPARSEQRSVS